MSQSKTIVYQVYLAADLTVKLLLKKKKKKKKQGEGETGETLRDSEHKASETVLFHKRKQVE